MVVEGLNKIYFHKQGSLLGLGAGEVSGGNLLLSDARILDDVVEGADNIGILKGLPKARDGLDDASDYLVYRVGDEVVLVSKAAKSNLLSKIKGFGDLPNLENLVKVLDDARDSKLISKLDELAKIDKVKLDNLNKHFEIFHVNRPSPFGKTDFNFTAAKSIEIVGVKYINGVKTSVSKTVDVNMAYKYGFAEFHKTQYCPDITLGSGSSGKYRYFVEQGLDFSTNAKYIKHFKQANTKLFDDVFEGAETATKNAEGFYQKGNYRWDGSSSQFELKNVDGTWEKYTWHHFQDGKTMFPVQSNIHSAVEGGFKHIGGKSLYTKGILGIFEFL